MYKIERQQREKPTCRRVIVWMSCAILAAALFMLAMDQKPIFIGDRHVFGFNFLEVLFFGTLPSLFTVLLSRNIDVGNGFGYFFALLLYLSYAVVGLMKRKIIGSILLVFHLLGILPIILIFVVGYGVELKELTLLQTIAAVGFVLMAAIFVYRLYFTSREQR